MAIWTGISLSVAVDGHHLDQLAPCLGALGVITDPGDRIRVGLPVPLGDDHLSHGPPVRLGTGPSEEMLGGPVPPGDPAVLVGAHHRVG